MSIVSLVNHQYLMFFTFDHLPPSSSSYLHHVQKVQPFLEFFFQNNLLKVNFLHYKIIRAHLSKKKKIKYTVTHFSSTTFSSFTNLPSFVSFHLEKLILTFDHFHQTQFRTRLFLVL